MFNHSEDECHSPKPYERIVYTGEGWLASAQAIVASFCFSLAGFCLEHPRRTQFSTMADAAEVEIAQPKKRTFKKFTFRGVDLDALLDTSMDELVELFHARARRRFQRGLKRKPMALIKKLRKAKREAPTGEKPEPVRTHLRNMIIVPEMIGSVIGVYNGKTFNQVEIKPEMIGHYLAEFSISYKPVKHGRPGIGATHSSRFIPLK
uniref:40S ribosomal protein S15 n=2 Tax=Physcomitrium patens TaxID=3218 RepID=A0A7I4AI39_PHYPA|eukprot:XP_024393490.1 40S ribosomal protein S15-like [Physcomitrella patens]